MATRHRGAHRRIPGPRQEYLDAFDSAHRPTAGSAPAGSASGGTVPAPAPAAPGSDTGGHPAVPGERQGGGPPHRHRRTAAREKGRGWGRTLTGAAAAGVVTALAITITGQLADGRADGAGTGRGDRADLAATEPGAEPEEGGTGRSQDRDPVSTEPAPEPDPPSYEEQMGRLVGLDPELAGSGELVPVPGTEPGADPDAADQLRYRVDVERGLDTIEPELFAEAVHRTLSDPRSWGNDGERSFTRVSSGDHDFVITLASPGTTAEWCAKSGLNTTVDNVSCDSANTERVMINAWRWAQGADTYGPERIHDYRVMLINHEVGHRIGYGHQVCPAEGAPAPVMMQQTKFLTLAGVTCELNAWPHPAN